jgi:chloride channel 3/4/5
MPRSDTRNSFWCAAVAAITLKWLNPFGNGSLVLASRPLLRSRRTLADQQFAVTYTKQYHYWEFGIFILLGVFGVSQRAVTPADC